MGLLSDSDVGKSVFDHEGNLLGKITDIGDDGATVRTDDQVDEQSLATQGWKRDDEHHLPHERVEHVKADGVHTNPPV